MLVLDYGRTRSGGLVTGENGMNKEKNNKDDFMMAFFDDSLVTITPDLAGKKDNLKYTDKFIVFKVEKGDTNTVKI
jgi:hypothetical protein